jgi:hypothetical protein
MNQKVKNSVSIDSEKIKVEKKWSDWNINNSTILMKKAEEFRSLLLLVNNTKPPKIMLNLIGEASEFLKI